MAVFTEPGQMDDSSPAESSYRDVLRAFRSIAEALSDTLELDVLLHLIADQVCGLLGANRCSIMLQDKESGLFRGRIGRSALDIDARVKRLVGGLPADGFTREIIETRRPVMMRDALSDPRAIRAAMRDWNTRSILGVPMILRDEVIGVMYIDNEGESHLFTTLDQELALTFAGLAATAIVQAQLNAELRGAFSKVARQNDLLRRANALEDQLSQLILSSSSLKEVCRAVTELIKKPCAIYDAQFTELASCRPEGVEDHVAERLFEEGTRTHPLIAEELEGLTQNSSRIIGPFPSFNIHRRALVVSIVRNGEQLGYLVVVEHMLRFGALDAVIARRAAVQIALDMGAEHRAEGTKWHSLESFAAALLRSSHDRQWLQDRASYLDLPLDVPRVVCLVGARDHRQVLPSARELMQRFDAPGERSRALVTLMGSEVAVAVELSGTRDAAAIARATDCVATAISACAPGLEVLIAASTVCSRAEDLPRAHDEAAQVIKCLRAHLGSSGTHILSADEMGPSRLFLAMATSSDARAFAERALGPLLDATDGKALEFLMTLHAFLDNHYNARRAAEKLGLHQNTVRYRIGRVEEMTGLKVSTDPHAQMTAHIAILVLRLGGKLAGIGVPGRRLDLELTPVPGAA